MAKKKIWVTTETNPFDPFTQFDRWMNWDFQCREGVCCALARRCGYSVNNLTDQENEEAIDIAVNDLLDQEYGTSLPIAKLDKDGKLKKDKNGNVECEYFTVHYVPAIEGQTHPFGYAPGTERYLVNKNRDDDDVDE